MECLINGTKVKYENGNIWRFGKKVWNSKEETWFVLKGYIDNSDGYQCHRTVINKKRYITSRILYKMHHPEWDIEDSSKNNSIDHISRNSLDNHIENLKVATASEQNLNRNMVIQAKGYYWNKNKWKAYISVNSKKIYLGVFELENDARQAYLNAIQKYRINIQNVNYDV